jgi:hypothetical protein
MRTRWGTIFLLLIAGLAVPRAEAQVPPVSPGAAYALGLERVTRAISQREDLPAFTQCVSDADGEVVGTELDDFGDLVAPLLSSP